MDIRLQSELRSENDYTNESFGYHTSSKKLANFLQNNEQELSLQSPRKVRSSCAKNDFRNSSKKGAYSDMDGRKKLGGG